MAKKQQILIQKELTPRLLNTETAAAYLGISPDLLRQWASGRKEIPFVKVGTALRYDRQDLDNFVVARKVEVD